MNKQSLLSAFFASVTADLKVLNEFNKVLIKQEWGLYPSLPYKVFPVPGGILYGRGELRVVM